MSLCDQMQTRVRSTITVSWQLLRSGSVSSSAAWSEENGLNEEDTISVALLYSTQ